MKIMSNKNVWDAAIERINFLFDEFPTVIAGFSGGKDSTVSLHLALEVARKRNRLPLRVFHIDQEAEWSSTVDTVTEVMYRPDVLPMWYQMPIHMDNATSFETQYLKVWDPEAEEQWCHLKDPLSIKVNRFGTMRFHKLFDAILSRELPRQKVAVIQGVRAEESPSRLVGLTAHPTYKWATWGNQMRPPYLYAFYPLYDWGYTDIWHAIHSNKWPYNKIYDEFYRYGVPIREMRVSNLHHETAVRSLFILQEIDPPLYERLVDRLPGVQTAGKMQGDFYAKELPFMFLSWKEYRDYLMEKIVKAHPDWYAEMKETAELWDVMLASQPEDVERTARIFVQAIVTNDYTGTKIESHRVQFITRFIYDRADQRNWTADDHYLRSSDPVAFDWLVRQIKNPRHSYEYAGHTWTKRGKYGVRVAGPDLLVREVIPVGADTRTRTRRKEYAQMA